MKSKDKISVERMIELECWLYDNYDNFIIYLNADNLNNFSAFEIEYLYNAYRMPYSLVSEHIDAYDTSSPKMDELKFIRDLEKEFRVPETNDVIKRIQIVRAIKHYCLYNYSVPYIPTVKKYDKLVRDNIPQIIKSNGEKPFTRVLSDKEYWKYLLKKDTEELEEVRTAKSLEERKKELADKLELIRAMAEYSGFSLDDIIEEADKKKAKNGGFERKLLLEKVIEK